MSNPLLDASTQALLDELSRRGAEQAALSESKAEARRAARLEKEARLRKERAFQALREAQEAEREWHERQDALELEVDRKARVERLLDAKRKQERVSFLSLANSTWMPTGESELDGSSRWDDFDKTIPHDMTAEDCVEDSKFKLQLAQSLNRSKLESEGDGPTWQAVKTVGYAVGQNRFYDRHVVQNPMWIGDNHTFAQGERGVCACIVVHDTPAVSFTNPSESSTITVIYAVEWVKRWIDLTRPAGQNLYKRVKWGSALPTEKVTKRHKNGQPVRDEHGRIVKVRVPAKAAFIYEPVRFIRIGHVELEIGDGIADDIDPIFDEDGNVVNADAIASHHNARRNLPSLAIQSTADRAVDIAYWWSEELKTLDYAVSDGSVEGWTIPGARQYGSDKAANVETLSTYAKKHGWTVTDLDMWVKRRRGLNPNADAIQAVRASLPEEAQ